MAVPRIEHVAAPATGAVSAPDDDRDEDGMCVAGREHLLPIGRDGVSLNAFAPRATDRGPVARAPG